MFFVQWRVLRFLKAKRFAMAISTKYTNPSLLDTIKYTL